MSDEATGARTGPEAEAPATVSYSPPPPGHPLSRLPLLLLVVGLALLVTYLAVLVMDVPAGVRIPLGMLAGNIAFFLGIVAAVAGAAGLVVRRELVRLLDELRGEMDPERDHRGAPVDPLPDSRQPTAGPPPRGSRE